MVNTGSDVEEEGQCTVESVEEGVRQNNIETPRVNQVQTNVNTTTTAAPTAEDAVEQEEELSPAPEAQNEDEPKQTAHLSRMQALEIEDSDDNGGVRLGSRKNDNDKNIGVTVDINDDDELDDDDDMEGLLEQQKRPSKKKKRFERAVPAAAAAASRCCASQRIGNTTVFWPYMYKKTGWGMMGPHFLGPPCVVALLWSASLYFIRRAIHQVGWITATICILFTIQATYYLLDTAFRDPGIVVQTTSYYNNSSNGTDNAERSPPPDRHHRWCDLCQAYQPPTGVHCPDCNVCVAGFDHHCAWMGCCIGQKNYKQFMRFNMTWLVYLLYAVIWVGMMGPVLFRTHEIVRSSNEGRVEESDIFVGNATDGEEGNR
ncbi:hypothetical protein ACA910_008584 [Epithemia clementina (nom. ined.)]